MDWTRTPAPIRRSVPSATRPRTTLTAVLAGALAVGFLVGASNARGETAGPARGECPADLAGQATCCTGRDANGAYYAIAVPADWNGSLVVHAHGGPDLGAESDPTRSLDDLGRWSVLVKEGYAWAGSSYRRGGYGTRMAAADTESVRRLFVEEFGKPRRTYVHGQSWGGNGRLRPHVRHRLLLRPGVPSGAVRLACRAAPGRAAVARDDGGSGAGVEQDRRCRDRALRGAGPIDG
ncbi:hypothetical protein ABIE67_008192 [Streptomyces sp. V4I8]